MITSFYTFTAEYAGERILKIGQHLAKLWARAGCSVFFLTHGVYAIITDCGSETWAPTACDAHRKSIRADVLHLAGTGNSGVHVDCLWLLRPRDIATAGALLLQIVSATVHSGSSFCNTAKQSKSEYGLRRCPDANQIT